MFDVVGWNNYDLMNHINVYPCTFYRGVFCRNMYNSNIPFSLLGLPHWALGWPIGYNIIFSRLSMRVTLKYHSIVGCLPL